VDALNPVRRAGCGGVVQGEERGELGTVPILFGMKSASRETVIFPVF